MTVEPPRACAECNAPLAADQRYCMQCGARAGARSAQLEALMAGAGERWGEEAPAESPRTPATEVAPAGAPSRASALKLPPPPVAAALVAVFLGFGILLGSTASSGVDNTLAANAGSRVRLVLPPAQASSPSTSTKASAPEAAASEPPASEPESTPAATAGANSTTKAAATAPASTGEGGSQEGGAGSSGGSSTPPKKLPPVKHVFVVMLSDAPYASVFGPASSARYLTQTLEPHGELLVRYDAVAHEELANGAALISGQGPTSESAANCPTYSDVAPATVGADEQVLGAGCVYPKATQTLAGQLTARHLTWRAYVEGIGEGGATAGACAHPQPGQADPSAAQTASTGRYATFRNPFVYFHSITDTPACASGDVGINGLKADLASATRTPSFAYIVPDRCHDGNPTPCSPGAPAGMAPADSFLSKVVPQITGSKAYKAGGLLVITVDEAPSSGEFADSSSCCGQPRFPNLSAPPTGLSPRGGGAVGALLLSPYVKGGTSQEPYNHFSLLRTIEDLFALKHLGYAALPKVSSFETSIFSGYH